MPASAPLSHGVGEVLLDRGALADRGLLRLGQAGRVRARRRDVDAQGGQRGAGGNPEAVLLSLGDSQVAPFPPGLRERQVRWSEADAERDVAAVRVARGGHARVGERLTRLVGRQPVVVGLAERRVGSERVAGQRRLDGGGRLRPAHAGRAHGHVRSLRRRGGAGGKARATADQETEAGADAHHRSFHACRSAASGLVRAARSAGYAPASSPTTLPISGAGSV